MISFNIFFIKMQGVDKYGVRGAEALVPPNFEICQRKAPFYYEKYS